MRTASTRTASVHVVTKPVTTKGVTKGVRCTACAVARGQKASLKSPFTASRTPPCHSRLLPAQHVKFRSRLHAGLCLASAEPSEQLQAVIFDCDGVIVESEDLHREAYNAAFAHHDIRCGGTDAVANWSEAFYDDLSNKIGGGKPKMRWYFGENGWPTSNILDKAPESEEDQATLIDTLQAWKSKKYQEIVGKDAEPRPGVLRLVDEARTAGLKVAVCSAATKSSVIHVVKSLFGEARYEALNAFLAGDDLPAKKPDPSIYVLAAERMGVQPQQCLVIEDSAIGLQAAQGAGMRCVITYTRSSQAQSFSGAELILESLDTAEHKVTVDGLMHRQEHVDDRLATAKQH